MASLASYSKAQLIELVEQYRTQIDDLSVANEALASGIDVGTQPEADAIDIPAGADMLVTGMLRACTPATYKDGRVVDDLHKFCIETSVRYTNGKDANGDWINERVNAYKSVWFDCNAELAQQINALLEANSWTLVRCWYRYKTSAKNVIQVKQVDRETGAVRTDEKGAPLFKKALKHRADLRALRIDVVTSELKSEGDDSNDVC